MFALRRFSVFGFGFGFSAPFSGAAIVARQPLTFEKIVKDQAASLAGAKRRTRTAVFASALSLLFVSPALAQFSQQRPQLVGTSAVGDAYQGRSVSLSADGNTAIVGGPLDNSDAGAVCAFAGRCAAIVLSPLSLPDGTMGTTFKQSITASSGTAPYTYAITSASLPAGLALSPGGALTGTPTAAGTFNFTVTATDADYCTGSVAYSLTINCAVITTGSPHLPIMLQEPRPLLPVRGIYVQFERRGWPDGYWSGQVITDFNSFDSVVGHTVAEEVALQLDIMRQMGVNVITFELRAADPTCNGPFGLPECCIHPVTGLRWPQPTSQEINNLVLFLDLINSKGMKVFLRLVNTHMEEQPPTNNSTWIGTILSAIKDHPALDLVLFEGNTHLADSDGDGVDDSCGIPAEPPLWMGPTAVPAQYVKWAISYAISLGMPARKLSAEAIFNDFLIESHPPGGPGATDGHLWSPIFVLKRIFDDLSISNDQRTYALSFYEHRKCLGSGGLPCIDADQHTWANETLQRVYDTIGRGNGARVVVVEMGANSFPVEANWNSEQALESLVSLMYAYGIDGGCLWRWTSFGDDEDLNPELASPVKRRGVEFVYNPVKDVLARLYTTPFVNPPVVTLIKKASPPFTLVMTGSNLQNAIKVYINNVQWPSVLWKTTGKIKLTGGASLKLAVPKGTPTNFTFVNPDGGEASQNWGW